jgi:hypothetical protein
MPRLEFQCQGMLDGLCGHYAIVNALTFCGVPETWKQQEKMFLFALGRAPNAYSGMSFKKMQEILGDMRKNRRRDMPNWPKALSARYPLKNRRLGNKKTRDCYLDILDENLSRETTRCAILQVQRCTDDWEEHWIVVKKSGNGLQFIDSINRGGSNIINKNWSSLKAGRQFDRNSSERAWHWIAERQLVLFEEH